MVLKYRGKSVGFPQHTYASIKPTRFLPTALSPEDYWRSPVTQPLILQDLKEFQNTSKRPHDLCLQMAIIEARTRFHIPGKVKMLHLNDVFQQDSDIWSRSPGLPWRNLGYKTKGEIRKDPDAVRRVRKFWHLVKLGQDIKPPDCCAFVRSHITNVGEYKVRGIWGYPATVTFGEAVFALPLIDHYKKGTSPIAYGYETSLGGAMKIRNKFSAKWNAAVDFKKFDKTVPTWLIEIAFAILSENIDFVHYEGHGHADAMKNYRMYNYLVDYFINTTVRMANGDRYQKNSGIASGSYFTQLVGSVVNFILIQWACYRQDIRISEILVLGDDSIFSSSEKFSLPMMTDLMESIGMKVNMSKSQVDQDLNSIKFLGYKINHGLPHKERNEWMAALMLPERPDHSWDDVASRALGLLYANCGVDDYFDSICRRIIHAAPYDLRLSANMERMLTMIGVKEVYKDPPGVYDFLGRLKVI